MKTVATLAICYALLALAGACDRLLGYSTEPWWVLMASLPLGILSLLTLLFILLAFLFGVDLHDDGGRAPER